MPEDIRTIIISPHLDDVALSLGGALLTEFFAKPILVINVFTESRHARFPSRPLDEPGITRMRSAEDDLFFSRLKVCKLDLGLPDAQLSLSRHQHTFPLIRLSSALGGHPFTAFRLPPQIESKIPRTAKLPFLLKAARVDTDFSLLRGKLLSLIGRFPRTTLVSPLGLGIHPDHLVVAEVCRSLESNAARTYYYEDLPYAAGYPLRRIAWHARVFNARLEPVPVDIEGLLERKIENLMIYRSQLRRRRMDQVRAYAQRVSPGSACERLWRPRLRP